MRTLIYHRHSVLSIDFALHLPFFNSRRLLVYRPIDLFILTELYLEQLTAGERYEKRLSEKD